MISTVLPGPVGPSAVPRSYCQPSTVAAFRILNLWVANW